ncbi:glycosyltransferase family 2 protein [Butyrivibrio sp. TB]|uniref:glycosyltransferase family 2 protein n=1 Tax=Butyrivibrio sp. TB TaxID=1520809 RepID=UPI0008C0CB08|nr:glycosyltransferase family 2 protein [Butyrivibrio sp. TB]SEQ23318.1 Glycosyltransferase involved in cell wall bisynthesis [Butyrivibrio sp. TB]
MTFDNKLISIIVAVYNVEQYLAECIDSILAQTYTNYELILVDDGSTDRSGEMCDEYSKKDSRIIVIHQKNGGISNVRNNGIRKSKGEYICFIDADDFVSPMYLQSLYETAIQNDANIVACEFYNFIDYDSISEELKKCSCETKLITEKDMEDEDFSAKNTVKLVVPSNKLYKRWLFDKIQYPEGKIHEDAYIYHRLLHEVKKIVFLSDVLYFYRIRKGSITHKKFNVKELEDSMGAVIDRIDFYHGLGKQRLTDIAIDGYLYFLWRNIDLMKKDGVKNYKEMIKPYIRIFRDKIRYLKVSKDYPFKKLLRMYYIAYLKTDY